MTAADTAGTLVCVDLDRTLIYSVAALATDRPDPLVCVELYQGAPQSFMLHTAATRLVELAERATVVPTTTRTVEQYRRVQVPGLAPRYAICANGGRLLVDGVLDDGWSAHVAQLLTAVAPLAEVHAHLDPEARFVRTVRVAEDLFVYAVVEREQLPEAWLHELAQWCGLRGWAVSMQGRKVYCVPEPLLKSTAAAEVRKRSGAHTMLAAGDSLLDKDLLLAADAAIRPRHGELHQSGWHSPQLVLTDTAGVHAGAEIVDWFDRHLRVRPAALTTL